MLGTGLILVLTGCSGSDEGGRRDHQDDDSELTGDTGSFGDADTDADSDADSDSETDTDTDADFQPVEVYFEDFENVQRASQYFGVDVHPTPYSEGSTYEGIVSFEASYGAGAVDLTTCGRGGFVQLSSPEQFDLTSCVFALLEYDVTLGIHSGGDNLRVSVDYFGMGNNTAVKAPWSWELEGDADRSGRLEPLTAHQRLPLGWDCGYEDAGAFHLQLGLVTSTGGVCSGIDAGAILDNVRITTWASAPPPSGTFGVSSRVSGDELEITITGGDYRGYMLGLSYNDGYFLRTREDCLLGEGGVVQCHPLAPDGGSLHLVNDYWVGVIPGYSIGYSASGLDHVTFALFDFDGACWTWGADPSYYTAAGCSTAPLP